MTFSSSADFRQFVRLCAYVYHPSILVTSFFRFIRSCSSLSNFALCRRRVLVFTICIFICARNAQPRSYGRRRRNYSEFVFFFLELLVVLLCYVFFFFYHYQKKKSNVRRYLNKKTIHFNTFFIVTRFSSFSINLANVLRISYYNNHTTQ